MLTPGHSPQGSSLDETSSDTRNKEGLAGEIYPETDLDNGIVGWDGQDNL
jgi:hypothetical protein